MRIAPQSLADQAWIASRFNHQTIDEAGVLVLYNSLEGTFARVPPEDNARVQSALDNGFRGFPTGIMAQLALHGFFVPEQIDEGAIADRQFAEYAEHTSVLQLILMPNENCNFRCVYCAQSFARNKMPREIIEGVIALVQSRAKNLEALMIGWFGGEPLTAPEVIEEISSRLMGICQERGILYGSSMTTNGYLLRPKVAEMLLRSEVRRFQITLDGSPEHHNRLRVLADHRTGTFDRIVENLRALRQTDEAFRVQLRVNFDRESGADMDAFIDSLSGEFAADGRFFFDFHPVGKWGGPHDAKLNVCGADEGHYFAIEFARKAAQKGFDVAAIREKLKPFGSRCYAANPHSFVIGSDGTVYKCTVAFEDSRNHVGRLLPNGNLVLDEEKHARWTEPGSKTVPQCASCSFRPACYGGACPIVRMETGKAACPTIKINLPQALRVLSRDLVTAIAPAGGTGLKS